MLMLFQTLKKPSQLWQGSNGFLLWTWNQVEMEEEDKHKTTIVFRDDLILFLRNMKSDSCKFWKGWRSQVVTRKVAFFQEVCKIPGTCSLWRGSKNWPWKDDRRSVESGYCHVKRHSRQSLKSWQLRQCLVSPILGYHTFCTLMPACMDLVQLCIRNKRVKWRLLHLPVEDYQIVNDDIPPTSLTFLLWNDYFYRGEFKIMTDNNPLTYVLTSAKLDAAGHGWLAALSNFNFSIQYRAGKRNQDVQTPAWTSWGGSECNGWRWQSAAVHFQIHEGGGDRKGNGGNFPQRSC